jgi:hypothetical protein
MHITKISAACTEREAMDDALFTSVYSHFYVQDAVSGELLINHVTQRDALEFIWLQNGGDYKVSPRMGCLYDENGNKTNLTRQLSNKFGLEWDVYFKDSTDAPWLISRMTAYGPTERRAMYDLLMEAVRREAWVSSDYYVGSNYNLNNSDEMREKLYPRRAKRDAVAC